MVVLVLLVLSVLFCRGVVRSGDRLRSGVCPEGVVMTVVVVT
ncbi:hypothetical protein JOD49_003490 [Oerskovia jenensis]|uniref:Uncharacterized protein n=1 Tax=Oerskovia jenensis TaxID=162169 RepID=A0ABS2LJH2_9CELL|nr:hypothetical protein [Oerskovia jenensis]MBM7498151.1 hypothetical protein [Oerskovia paurometabola]